MMWEVASGNGLFCRGGPHPLSAEGHSLVKKYPIIKQNIVLNISDL